MSELAASAPPDRNSLSFAAREPFQAMLRACEVRGGMRFADVGYADCVHVIDHLRPADRVELEAVFGADEMRSIAPAAFAGVCREAWAAFTIVDPKTELPIAVWGIAPAIPTPSCTRGLAFLAGTDGFTWPRIRALGRFLKDAWPHFRAAGVRRVECRALAANVQTRRWLMWTGAKLECQCLAHGVGGEAFSQLAWI